MTRHEKFLLERWRGWPLARLFGDVLDDQGDMAEAIRSLSIMGLGLAGEAGEAAEHVKKLIRDRKLDRAAFALELGDVLAYLTWLSAAAGYTLEEIGTLNQQKLEARDQ